MESEGSSKSWRKGVAAMLAIGGIVGALWTSQSWLFIEQNQTRIILCAVFGGGLMIYLRVEDYLQAREERELHSNQKTASDAKLAEAEKKAAALQEQVNGLVFEYSRRILRVHREWLKTRDTLVSDLTKAATNIGNNLNRPEFGRHMNNNINQHKDVRPELTEVTQALGVTKETL